MRYYKNVLLISIIELTCLAARNWGLKKMNKNVATTMIVLLTAILLLGGLALIVYLKLDEKNSNDEPTIDDILKVSVDIPEITTNLKNGDFVKISFKVQTDGKKAKEELEKREFQVNNLIISELSEMNVSDLAGKDGKEMLQEKVESKINELMQQGKVIQVYITSYVIS